VAIEEHRLHEVDQAVDLFFVEFLEVVARGDVVAYEDAGALELVTVGVPGHLLGGVGGFDNGVHEDGSKVILQVAVRLAVVGVLRGPLCAQVLAGVTVVDVDDGVAARGQVDGPVEAVLAYGEEEQVFHCGACF